MKLSRIQVKRAIKAYAHGWTNRKIASDVFNVTERTFYNWMVQGRKNYIRVNTVEVRKHELSRTELLKMELFEGIKAGGVTRDELLDRLENRIIEFELEKEEKAEYRAWHREQRIKEASKQSKPVLDLLTALKEASRALREIERGHKRAKYYLSRLK